MRKFKVHYVDVNGKEIIYTFTSLREAKNYCNYLLKLKHSGSKLCVDFWLQEVTEDGN